MLCAKVESKTDMQFERFSYVETKNYKGWKE